MLPIRDYQQQHTVVARPIKRLHKGKPYRARIVGYRDRAGQWHLRNPRNGHWYVGKDGRHPGRPPTDDDLAHTDSVNVELEYDGKTHFFNAPGPVRGRAWTAGWR